MRVVHHGVRVLVLYEVPRIMLKQTILGNLKFWPLWDVDDKLIFVLAVVDHRVAFCTNPKDRILDISLGLYHTVL